MTDREKIQAIIDSSSNWTAYIPAGTYVFMPENGKNASVKIPSHMQVIMDRNATIYSGGERLGVNGYGSACFVNSDPVNGNSDIHISGGTFIRIPDTDGGVFIALKNVSYGSIKDTRMLNTYRSCKAQISYCTDFIISGYYAGWEGNEPEDYQYQDGFRIGSGCKRVMFEGVVNSGDDAVAVNNEECECEGQMGSDIEDINISAIVRTRHGHGLRIYVSPGMTAGTIRRINATIIGSISHSVDGISVSDYSQRHSIKNVEIIVNVDVSGVAGNGALVNYCNDVSISGSISNFERCAVSVNNSQRTSIFPTKFYTGRSRHGYDAVIIGNGSDHSIVSGGYLSGAARDGIRIWNSSCCKVIGTTALLNGGWGVAETDASDYNLISNNILVNNGAGSLYSCGGHTKSIDNLC